MQFAGPDPKPTAMHRHTCIQDTHMHPRYLHMWLHTCLLHSFQAILCIPPASSCTAWPVLLSTLTLQGFNCCFTVSPPEIAWLGCSLMHTKPALQPSHMLCQCRSRSRRWHTPLTPSHSDVQIFDASKQKQYPVANRYIQTILSNPTTVQAYGSQLQPPQQACSYNHNGGSKWGEGSSPLQPISHLFAQPWSGKPAEKFVMMICRKCMLISVGIWTSS